MKRLRSRLLFAFIGVAVLAMIPLIIVPSIVLYYKEADFRQKSIRRAFETHWVVNSKAFNERIEEQVFQPTVEHFRNETFREFPELVEMLVDPNSVDPQRLQEDLDFRNGQIYNMLNTYIQQSEERSGDEERAERFESKPLHELIDVSSIRQGQDYRIITLPEYRNLIKQIIQEGEQENRNYRIIEEDGRLYYWLLHPLPHPTWKIQTVGALFFKILLIDKTEGTEIQARKHSFLRNSPFIILQPHSEILEPGLNNSQLEKLFDLDGQGDYRNVRTTRVQIPAIMNGEPAQASFFPLINLEGDLSAIMVIAEPIMDMWRYLGPHLLLSFPITLLSIMVVAILMARSISRPIHSLASAAQTMAEGRFDVRVDKLGSEEQQQLSEAFNRMAARIENQMAQLTQKTGELEQRNRELDQTQRFLQNVLSNVFTGVMSLDARKRIRHLNPVGESIFRVTDWQDRPVHQKITSPTFLDLIDSAVQTGKSIYRQEISCQVEDMEAEFIPLQVSMIPVREENQLAGLVITFHDLSEIRKLEDQVRRQDRLAALGRMSAGVAHEIRNPLGIIRGSAQLLHKRFGGEPGEEGLSEFIIEEVNRLSRVVNDFLMFARPPEPVIQETSVDMLMAQIEAYAPISEDQSSVHSMRTEIEEGLANVAVDPALCREAFLNLVLNAQEAMEEGGEILIRAHTWGEDFIAIDVIDQGNGIDHEQMDRIFDPFYTSKDNGTGLGLSLVHQIISSHGGRIEVESVPGEGAQFRVILPTQESVQRDQSAQVALET